MASLSYHLSFLFYKNTRSGRAWGSRCSQSSDLWLDPLSVIIGSRTAHNNSWKVRSRHAVYIDTKIHDYIFDVSPTLISPNNDDLVYPCQACREKMQSKPAIQQLSWFTVTVNLESHHHVLLHLNSRYKCEAGGVLLLMAYWEMKRIKVLMEFLEINPTKEMQSTVNVNWLEKE